MGAAASCVGSKEDPITSGDVEVAQEAWAKGIVDIGKVYQDKGDYKAKAEEVITELYGFKEEGMEVLFKPTKASEVPIRHDYDQAVSYFVGAAAAGDDIGIKEDKGFAINPWTVRCGVKTRIRASRCARRRCASRTRRRSSMPIAPQRWASTTSRRSRAR